MDGEVINSKVEGRGRLAWLDKEGLLEKQDCRGCANVLAIEGSADEVKAQT